MLSKLIDLGVFLQKEDLKESKRDRQKQIDYRAVISQLIKYFPLEGNKKKLAIKII